MITANTRPHAQRRFFAAAFGLSALAGALFILPFSFHNGGFFYLGSDFVEQQVPFWSYCIDAVKRGDIFWTPGLDLGTGFTGAFSFYVLGSPFFWLALLLPGSLWYRFIGLFLILKMGVCGLTSYAWLRQYASPRWALTASLLYSFSGFQLSNMNFNHFYDVTAFFPLLLLALDAAMKRDKRFVFGAAAALMATVNTVFFPGEVLFLCLYLGVKLWCGEYRMTVRRFARLAGESILGVGLSAFLLLPTVFALLQNPRVENASFQSIGQMLLLKPIYWAELVRGMLFPAECIFDRGFYMQSFTNGAELYLPVFGVVLAAAYLLRTRKGWMARLIAVCAVFAVIPVLNSAFVLFNAEYYTRWYYMPILILCAATARALEDESLPLRSGHLFYGGLWLALGAVGLSFTYYYKVTFIYNLVPVLFFAAVSLGGFVLTLFLRRIQRQRCGAALLTAAVVICCAATGAFNTNYHSRSRTAADVYTYDTAARQISLPETEDGWRIYSNYYFMNLGLVLDTPTVTSFASNISGSAFDFYNAVGVPRTVITQLEPEQQWLQAFLSVRYSIQLQDEAAAWDARYEQNPVVEGKYSVAENRYTVPMGFVFDCYITQREFEALDTGRRQAALLKALVLTDAQVQKYGGLLRHLDAAALRDTSDAALAAACEERSAQAAARFAYTNTGAEASITLARENLVLFTIPYDTGFTATVNGKKAEIEKTDYGFMAVRCPAGESRIVFRYLPQGLRAGIGISIASALLAAGWSAWHLAAKRRK